LEILKKLYLFFDPGRDIDYFVIDRRGEKTLIELLRTLREDKDVGVVHNIGILVGNKVRFTPRFLEIGDVNDEIIDWDSIPDYLLKHTVSLRGSAGCPFKCEFCNFHFYAPNVLRKPLATVIQELDQLSRRPQVKHISFVDDNFLTSAGKMEEFCGILADRKYPFTWSSFIRADSVTKDNIDLVTSSGANFLSFGVESGSPRILANMNKRVQREHVLEVINGMGERGVSTHSTLIVGFPGETSETVDQTIDFLNSYKSSDKAVHWISPFVFMMLPKVRVERDREKYGLDGFMLKWHHNTMEIREACLQLRRIMLNMQEVQIPYSHEFPLAAEVLHISNTCATSLIKFIREHVKNQMRFTDTKDQIFLMQNRAIFEEIKKIIAPDQD
jgi:radical SAM superfamily enzyme YgiQ (UPF0313 family)